MTELSTPSTRVWVRWSKIALGCVLTISVIYFIITTIHWPLVGDASLIHYISFLMDHGMAPYRDLGDMNMPGSYLIEWSVVHTLGGGALAWRIFDFSLAAAALVGMICIALPYDWFAGLFAGVLFMLAHGRDGIHQSGQRDLTLAVLLIVAYAFLFYGMRRNHWWATGLFGLCAGIGATIKPTAIPLGILLLLLAVLPLKKNHWRIAPHLYAGIAGLMLPIAVVGVFLVQQQALSAFLHNLRTVVPYYASLGHLPFSTMIVHSVSPFVLLVILWIAFLGIRLFSAKQESAKWDQWEHLTLWIGLLFSFASYVAQHKDHPYHRYPFLAILLAIMSIDVLLGMQRRGLLRLTAVFSLALGALFLAPRSAYLAGTYDWRTLEFMDMLEADINALGGQQLSGHIQCIDWISGCNTTLYRMKLVQQTGMLADFLILGPDSAKAVQEARAKFWQQIHQEPPKVIIVTSFQHLNGSDNFEKMDLWPELQTYLASDYMLVAQRRPPDPVRWWNHAQKWAAYRIYVLKNSGVK
ncbi:MAG TPA: hypothetical protein VHT24_17915 [Pseudacidobacterium sp.]|jgi:hypothetical protein|nr:hypothetical protein [Pseudacidobacterium sp.]